MKELDPGLEQLLKFKSYEELNQEERDRVEQHCSPDEYARFRLIISEGKAIHSNPSPKVREELLQKMQAQQNRTSPLIAWAGNKVPLWQAAAACLMLLLASQLFMKKPAVNGEPRIVYQRDTIEQIKVLHDTIIQTLYTVQPAVATVFDSILPTALPDSNPIAAVPRRTLYTDSSYQSRPGRSIMEDSSLLRLTMEVY